MHVILLPVSLRPCASARHAMAPTGSAEYQLEDFRDGYPQFAALLGAAPGFQIYRRFARLRQRLLLLKQDRVSKLEEELDEIDKAEQRPYYLSSSRVDRNEERLKKMDELSEALEKFDTLVANSQRACSLQDPASRDVESVVNWTNGIGSIPRNETAYLDKRSDLMSVAQCEDRAIEWVEGLLETVASWYEERTGSRTLPFFNATGRRGASDRNVFFYGSWTKTTSRALMAWLTTLLLLAPVFILAALTTMAGRLAAIAIATLVFIFAVSFLTRAKTTEVFLSAAAYAAVLVVFTSANNGLSGR